MKNYIEHLKADLYEAKINGIPEKFIQAKYNNLSRINDYYEKTEAYINDMELDYFLDTEALKQRIVMLEAILLIHGINDFPVYLSKGKDYLMHMAVENNSKGIAQLPAAVNDVLTDKQRSEILNYIKDAVR